MADWRNLSTGEIFHRMATKGVVDKSSLRQFEKVCLKLENLKLDLDYFDRCAELNLIPEFLKFKPPNLEVYNNSNAFYQKVLNEQRRLVLGKLTDCKKDHKQQACKLTSSLSIFEFSRLTECIYNRSIKKVI